MTAERTALCGLDRRMTSRAPSWGSEAAKMAGMMAKYLATSLATLKVVRARG
jgi:hypothetical protein